MQTVIVMSGKGLMKKLPTGKNNKEKRPLGKKITGEKKFFLAVRTTMTQATMKIWNSFREKKPKQE